MRRTWSVTVARYDQPETQWRRVGEVMRSWSADATITPVGEIMWLADTGSASVADALAHAVGAVGAEPLRSSRTLYDEADYTTADLIGITGVDLSREPPFVRNEARAYRAVPPCPRCGHQDPFDVTVVEPPRIDEDLLDAPAPDGTRPGPQGWEVVNLPNGGLLLARRLADAVRDSGIRGLVTEEVSDASGATSTRVVALRAPVAALAPCPRHTRVEGGAFCPTCGAAHGDLDGYFWMPRSAVGDAEIVSRHPRRAAMVYVSARCYAILGGVPGVRRGEPVRVCAD